MRTYQVSLGPEVLFESQSPRNTPKRTRPQCDKVNTPLLCSRFSRRSRTRPREARKSSILGGYLGGFGLAAAALGYEVVIVEANPQNARAIRASIAGNSFAHAVGLVEAAAGPSDGEVNFVANGPWGHVAATGSNPAGTCAVRQLSLVGVIRETGWVAPDFIKMDVEGSEARVLRGARSWFLEGHKPTLLYEANGHTLAWFGDSPAMLRHLVGSFGYHQYEVEQTGGLRIPSSFEPWCIVDYVASAKPLFPVQPARSAWQVLRRTAAALTSASSTNTTMRVAGSKRSCITALLMAR